MWWAPPSRPAQVLESLGAGGWLSNSSGELWHQRVDLEAKRPPGLPQMKQRSELREEKGNEEALGKVQMKDQVSLVTRQRRFPTTSWVGYSPSSLINTDKEILLIHQRRRDRPSTVTLSRSFGEAKISHPQCHPNCPGQKDAKTSPGNQCADSKDASCGPQVHRRMARPRHCSCL